MKFHITVTPLTEHNDYNPNYPPIHTFKWTVTGGGETVEGSAGTRHDARTYAEDAAHEMAERAKGTTEYDYEVRA